jgi:ubiquitin-protein ligase
LDLQLAWKLQQELYADIAPPPPTLKPPKPLLQTYDKNEVRPPPSPEAIKRIMTDYQELLKSNNPLMYTPSYTQSQSHNHTQTHTHYVFCSPSLLDFFDLRFFKRHAVIDEEDVTHVEALIIGPPDTPYDGGFFHFGTDYSN